MRKQILGELQNGFRKDRRLEDNLYIIAQCIEIAMTSQRPLWVAFLDIKGAYDNVNQEKLWDQLKGYGLGGTMVKFLERVYMENKVVITWEAETTRPAAIKRGLRQGCPLSPLLFMIYLCELEKRLEQCQIGFDLTYMEGGRKVNKVLPALMYADDIVLVSESRETIQELIKICGREGDTLGLNFSREKSGIIVFNDEKGEPLEIQDTVIEHVEKYKYLGVWLNEGRKYLKEHEDIVIKKGKRDSAIMKHRALWNYNRYEVVRGVWKGVMVPGLSFGNAVLCMRSEIQAGLEIQQRSVGRLALGAHGNTPNEGVQGDMGWTSFECREAISKINFEQRLAEMEDTRWAGKVYKYLYMKSLNTKWTNRTRKLRCKYIQRDGDEQNTSIEKRVKETERKWWEERMQGKSALTICRAQKQEIKKEQFYDNSLGSSLLFAARTGVLRTKTYRAKFQEIDTLCDVCNREQETIEHVILRCTGLRPTLLGGMMDLQGALGFADVDGRMEWERIVVTKRRLEDWWKRSREG